MTTDPFAEAARAEAERRVMGDSRFAHTARDLLVGMAEWARAHLAAQEPTDAEREAVMEALDCQLRSLFNGQTTCDEHGRRASTDDVCWAADAALAATRPTRRDEEDRP